MKYLRLIIVMCWAINVNAQMKEEILTSEYGFEKAGSANVFQLSNINVFIKVEAYSGNKIMLEVRKQIWGKTDARVNLGMKEIGVALLDRYDTLIVYASGPCQSFGFRNSRHGNGYSFKYNNCNYTYEFKLDMTLKVPAGTNLVLRTVNNGDIEVSGVSGNLRVNNINGAILLDGVVGKVVAHTINGDVDVNYTTNPKADSRYYTLNGDINANFKKGLAAKIAFKSFNGDIYTNLPQLKLLAESLQIESIKDGKGIKFKIEDRKIVQTRNGSVLLDFETFNGDAIIKEN